MKTTCDLSTGIISEVPFTAEEQAAIDAGAAAFDATQADRTKAAITVAVQKRLDDFAKTKSYDGIMSACTYATDPNPIFAAEGQYCVNQRSATWSKCYQILTEVQIGVRSMPSGYDDIENELPQLLWPVNP